MSDNIDLLGLHVLYGGMGLYISWIVIHSIFLLRTGQIAVHLLGIKDENNRIIYIYFIFLILPS